MSVHRLGGVRGWSVLNRHRLNSTARNSYWNSRSLKLSRTNHAGTLLEKQKQKKHSFFKPRSKRYLGPQPCMSVHRWDVVRGRIVLNRKRVNLTGRNSTRNSILRAPPLRTYWSTRSLKLSWTNHAGTLLKKKKQKQKKHNFFKPRPKRYRNILIERNHLLLNGYHFQNVFS